MSERELLPCPFCGKPARLNQYGNWFHALCSGEWCCGTKGSNHFTKKDEAIEQWNTRAVQIIPQAGEAAVDKYVDDYVFEHDEGYYTPTTAERTLIKDAIMGFLPLLDDAAADCTAPPQGEAEPDVVPDEFAEWWLSNYGPGCVLSRPEWHLPKIWRAAARCIKRRPAPPRPVCPHIRSSDEGTQWCDLAAKPVALRVEPTDKQKQLFVQYASRVSKHGYTSENQKIAQRALHKIFALPPDSPGATEES